MESSPAIPKKLYRNGIVASLQYLRDRAEEMDFPNTSRILNLAVTTHLSECHVRVDKKKKQFQKDNT